MKRVLLGMVGLVLVVSAMQASAAAALYNGAGDYQTDSLGYYYAVTGGKFVNGQTVTGVKTTGGSMAYTLDDSAWGSYATGVWNKDGWFAQTAGLALTMKDAIGTTLYDNNGILDGTTGGFYDGTGKTSTSVPGLYRGYSMSNNFDWIYAGYFVLTEPLTITSITGFFDENAGFDRNSPSIQYRMNIWSNLDVAKSTYIEKRPTNTGGFDGDVLSSDKTAGTFSWNYEMDRIFGDDYGNAPDAIFSLTYTLDTPITLPAGEYWFSHDASIVPEPATLLVWSVLGVITVGAAWWRRRYQKA